jgi:hypothetical protein
MVGIIHQSLCGVGAGTCEGQRTSKQQSLRRTKDKEAALTEKDKRQASSMTDGRQQDARRMMRQGKGTEEEAHQDKQHSKRTTGQGSSSQGGGYTPAGPPWLPAQTAGRLGLDPAAASQNQRTS